VLTRVVVAIAALVVAAPTRGRADALRVSDAAGRVVDWTAGQLMARGLGVADRHAPRPEVARDAARQRALADARRELVAAARQLPLADGRRLGEALRDDALAAAAATATLVSGEPQVDGSWRVELALPLEALRQAAAGARALPAAGDVGAALLVIRAPAAAGPQLGVVIRDGAQRFTGATLWTKGSVAGLALPAAALGKAPTVDAKLVTAGAGRPGAAAVELHIPTVSGVTDATLFVVVLGQ
jgi:hypothetical protein